jgi:transposase
MIHPKMRYTYVGIDSHKDSHTAVFMDCFFEKIGEITFENMPSKFDDFLRDAQKFQMENTVFMFGMEDISVYGRSLTLFFKENNQHVKHVNALLVARERKNQNITQKTDSIDAECAARVLLSKFSELPDANPQDKFWILRTLVIRRDILARQNAALKNVLHNLLTQHYPNYRNFFSKIDGDTSLAFYNKYPSPHNLQGVTIDELAAFLREESNRHFGQPLAEEILDTLQDTTAESQEVRDMIVQSTIRQIRFNLGEMQRLEESLAKFLATLDCTLISMAEIDVVSASQILSCIGDIKRFPTPAKLARYAGIAPVTYASGKKDLQFANQRGNRELNSHLFKLAQRLTMTVGSSKIIINSFFYDYYHKKISEGKTKRQALK